MPKKQRKLNSDDLGRYGEGKFVNLCESSGLFCNQPKVDRTGWDVLVEFKPDHNFLSGNIETPNPYAILVQCKSLWCDNNNITVRLSSLARIAKDSRPSFMCVMKMDDDLNVVELFMIHFLDDTLSWVLSTIHNKTHDTDIPINKISVNFDPSKIGRRVELSGDSLVKYFCECIGPNANIYTEKKLMQFNNLGKNKESSKLKFSLDDGDTEKFIESMLGLKSPFEISDGVLTHTRFGVATKDVSFPSSGTFNINPATGEQCGIVMRDDYNKVKSRLSGKILTTPRVIRELSQYPIAAVHTDFLSIKIWNHKYTMQFDFGFGGTKSATLDSWRQHLFFITHASTKGTISILPSKIQKFKLPFQGKNDENIESYLSNIKTLDMIEQFMEQAGCSDDELITSDQLSALGREIRTISRFVSGNLLDIMCEHEDDENFDEPSVRTKVFWIRYYQIGKRLIVVQFSSECDVKSNSHRISARSQPGSLKLLDIDTFSIAEYESFIDELKDNDDPRIFISQLPPGSSSH